VTAEQIIGLILTLLVMGIGVAGSVLPGLPGPPLVLAAAIGHRLYFGDTGASTLILAIMGALMLLSLGLDYLASIYGAKKMGATWRGVTGAVVGAVIGLFFSLPGIILGPFVGATALEMLGGRKWPEAARAGLGAVVGILVGAVGKLASCVAMVALFVVSVLRASLA